jgi:hypothetical protein
MGCSTDYPNVPEWVSKSEGYQTGAMVKYKEISFLQTSGLQSQV